jgi:hypothetical protein
MTLNRVKLKRILRVILLSMILYVCLLYFSTDTARKSQLPNVTFTIKTSQKHHHSRLKLLLDTWINLVKSNVFIISDANDFYLQKLLSNNLLSGWAVIRDAISL